MKYLILMLATLAFSLGCSEIGKVALEKPDGKKVMVELPVYAVKVESFSQNLMITGTTKPFRAVNIAPAITARVIKILVEENAQVKKGAKLIRLDAKSASFGAVQARANAISSKANTQQLEIDYARLLPLAKSGTIPQSRIDQLKLQLDVAKSQQNAAGAAAGSASNMASNATIRAPFDATVVGIPAEVGQMAMAPSATLIRLADLSVLKVTFQVKEADLNKIKVGDVVDVEFPAVEQKTKAEVVSISFEINPSTRSAEVVAHVVNTDRKYRSGLFAKIKIPSGNADSGIFVPTSAVQSEKGENWVFVVEGGLARKKMVDVKLMSDGRYKILKGIVADEQVIMAKIERVSDGRPVKITPWSPKENN